MHIIFKNGGNPYITRTPARLISINCKYEVEQVESITLEAGGLRKNPPKTYSEKKDMLEEVAKEWQYNFASFNYDWLSLSMWGDFFESMGKRYGLLTVFRENGII